MASRRCRLFATGLSFALLVLSCGCLIPGLRAGHGCVLYESPVGNMRMLNTAVITYLATYDTYPPTLAALGPPLPGESVSARAAGLTGREIASGNRQGYLFRFVRKSPSDKANELGGYLIFADPISEAPGKHHYFTDEEAVIRSEENRPATAKSAPTHDSSCTCW